MNKLQRLSLFLSALVCAACQLAPAPVPSTPAPSMDPIRIIAFGSCAEQDQPQPIWDAVIASRPDRFVFLGDNIYGDTTDMAVLRAKYEQLGQQPGYRRLRESTQVVATWDDHDYGVNDGGAEYPQKAASKAVFLDFFGEPADSERRLRDGGIYTAYLDGPPGRRVQLLLLDTRWDRSPLTRVSEAEYAARRQRYVGPYTATTGPDARLLGEDQWSWLEAELRRPAEVRIIATSIPFLQEGSGWENWSNFPDERRRLIDLIVDTGAGGVLFITGDTHRAQFSRWTDGVPYPLWEVNSSGLTRNYDRPVPDQYRVGDIYTDDNYGLIRIDWEKSDPEIHMEIRNVENALVMQQTVRLSELQMPSAVR
ncbi:MAG: alkaline phosphatase family protein [Caldilineaceae bacterium]|nr:alkaline phosphatase family protein [Caldilineaceae bacterium]